MLGQSRLKTLTIVLLFVCSAMAVDKSQSAAATRSSYPTGAGLARHHVFLLVLENREYQPSQDPPYLSGLRRRGLLATRYYGISHPSLPNYLALLSGATHGIVSDCTNCFVSGRTLIDQLETRRLSWGAYMEDVPKPCFGGSSFGNYAMKHNPFMYFYNIRESQTRCHKVQPLRRLLSALKTDHVPNFVWITPNLCHDGHDCSLNSVDTFLKGLVPPLLASRAFRAEGTLFITYDEGDSDAGCCKFASGGHVETLVLGRGVKAGSRSTIPLDHYSVLRSIEDNFRLSHLAHAGCQCTRPIIASWAE
jgi:phosphatidylinositol-3-phosphatase